MGKIFWESNYGRNFGYDVTYIRPSARTDCRGGGGETRQPLGTGVFGQFSLTGNRVPALHLTTAFFWWEIILVISPLTSFPSKCINKKYDKCSLTSPLDK